MIEIIAIYLTSKNIAEIAQGKGYSKGLWRFLTILSWIICEFIGAVFGFIVIGQEGGLLLYAFAIIGALLGVFIVRKIIDSKPDLTKNDNSSIED
jgi:hypothetical protein